VHHYAIASCCTASGAQYMSRAQRSTSEAEWCAAEPGPCNILPELGENARVCGMARAGLYI